MSKIYNEIVIDMNPESPDFEKVIYEDSFEHSGDMMLALEGLDPNMSDEEMLKVLETLKKAHRGTLPAEYQTEYDRIKAKTTGITKESEVAAREKSWGAADISVDDFVDPATGEQLPLFKVAKNLDPKLPGITGQKLMQQIKDMAPKYQSIAKKEKEQKGFAKEARDKDVYGISKEARKVGAKARSVYGGMGASMRGAATAGADIAKGFKETQQAYKKDIYGIEQKAAGEYEGAISKFIDPKWLATEGKTQVDPDKWKELEGKYESGIIAEQERDKTAAFFEEHGGTYDIEDAGGILGKNWALDDMFSGMTPEGGWPGQEDTTQGREGGYVYKDRSGIGNNRGKTFLDLMISLPDAGGS
tara:strand:- start:152 stop:1228 length:1077 start_codon:yes stop_codon:yes gene_type:complete